MPGSKASKHVKSAAWIAGLLALLPAATAFADQSFVAKGAGPTSAQVLFWVCAAATLAGALLTISLRNPVSAAMSLVMTLVFTGGIYLSLHATFMAAIQVLVYAGAIMVLFIFVVMSVANYDRQEHGIFRGSFSKFLGLAAVGYFTYRLITVLKVWSHGRDLGRQVGDSYGNVVDMGKLLFSDYLFPFEAISLLLLVAIVGAVIVSRKPGRAGEQQEGA
jgi:NADH-quinone oxidoreductase subunit J